MTTRTKYYMMRETPLAYLFLIFFGVFGVHQFYMGHIQKGLWIIGLFFTAFLSLFWTAGLLLYNVEVSSSVTPYGAWLDSFAITVPAAGYRHYYIPLTICVLLFGVAWAILLVDFFTLPRQIRLLNARLFREQQ